MGFLQNFLNNLRGKSGESRIARKLNIVDFFGYDGMCIRNLYIPRRDGSTSEIDLIYITVKGVFVIESKNYSGYIFGNDRNRNWTSTFYAGKTWYGGKKVEKYHFYNPVWQNNSHIKALGNYMRDLYAYSIVVFGDDCEIKDISISTPGTYICYASKLNRTIKEIWNSNPDVYSAEQVQNIYKFLLPFTNADSKVRAKHVQDIRYGNSSGICPWCGGKLVLRTAQKGKYAGSQFYGCSNYPKCKYIKK